MGGLVKIFIGFVITIAGGYLGLRILLFISTAFVAGFLSVALTKGFFSQMSSYFESFTSAGNASVLSVFILALPPLLIVGYLGRMLVARLGVIESMSKMVDSVLGAGYFLSIFIVVVYSI